MFVDNRNHIKKIEVCCGSDCIKRGVQDVFDTVQKDFAQRGVDVVMCSCLGNCKRGPNILVDEKRILHYTKPRTVTQKILSGDGRDHFHYNEKTLELEDDFLGDI